MDKQKIIELSKEKTIALDFYADWCSSCVIIKPWVEEAAQESGVETLYINIDEYDKDQLKSNFGVIAIPNIQFWRDGKKVDFSVGKLPKEKIFDKFNKYK
jgi:thioredoxin 1